MNVGDWKKLPPDEAAAALRESVLGRIDAITERLSNIAGALDEGGYLDAADECYIAHLMINEVGTLLMVSAHRFQPEEMAERQKAVVAHAFREMMGVERPNEN